MTETPEWFELTADDQGPKQPKRKRFLKIALITAPLILVGGAVVAATHHDDAPAAQDNFTLGPTSAGSEQIAPSGGVTTPNGNFASPGSQVMSEDSEHGEGFGKPRHHGEGEEHQNFGGEDD